MDKKIRAHCSNARIGFVADYLDHMVEIALGPKGAFENGNIGALRRRMLSDRVVNAVLPSRGDPKPTKVARTPRVVELLRKALEWQTLLESGRIASQGEIAHREGVTRARVTQIMGMLRLAPFDPGKDLYLAWHPP